MVLIASV